TYPVNKHGSHSSRTDSPQSFSLLLTEVCYASLWIQLMTPPPPQKKKPKQKQNINKKQKNKSTAAVDRKLRQVYGVAMVTASRSDGELKKSSKPSIFNFLLFITQQAGSLHLSPMVLFCREHSFNKEQTSTLLSIIKSIHEANVETPLNNSEQCFKYCRELLLCHSVRRPPFSISLFNADEVNRVLTYILNNYMKHYKLYKYIFTTQVNLCCRHNFYSPTQPKKSHARNGFISSLSGATSELKALIEQQVREQMMLVSGQLDQRIKEKASQQNSALDYSQNSHKAKK
uniref:Cilia and flagella associated protein 119 n=1 Tax=Haplochromis burtoni TaxID=8153 RepID=A0A3Q2V080_HAPBU